MDHPNSEKKAGKPRILVAPLDWGLGHTTRCIPVIRELIHQGADVIVAGEDVQLQLLTAEFPGILFIPLQGYHIRYSRTGGGLPWKMIRQGPRIQRAIRYEHQWLKQAVKEHKIDAVVSDNRFGLYHKDIPCIFITHQLAIKSPWGRWTEKILQQRNYRYINRFTECWVPDQEGAGSLAGKLSHPLRKPMVPVKYTGWLSRFSKTGTAEIEDHLLIILSGPEPQRSLLENRIIEDISRYNGTAVVVRGLPGAGRIIPSTDMIRFHNHLPAAELNTEMQKAGYVISRSGYSTVMDAATLGKKCIFIPTPGQTEQQYLGQYLMKMERALCVPQEKFSLQAALGAAKKFSYQPWGANAESLLAETIHSFLLRLSARL
ncbi:MAG: glycosyltransferase [Chitinophagaceae bacterium]